MDNITAKLSTRLTRGARNGQIVGFAAVCLMRDGTARTTWHAASDQFLTLAGGAAGLANEISFYQQQMRNAQGLPIAKRGKVKKKK